MKGERRIILYILLIFALLLGGCWNRRELDQRAIISAIGIDRGEDNKIKLTAQIVKTTNLKEYSEEGGTSKAFYVLSASGDTIFEASRNFVTQSGRKLYYPHNNAIILGGTVAREGVTPVLDLFMRDHEMRLLTWVLVTEGKASDIVEAESPVESVSARQMDMLLKDFGAVSYSVDVNLLDISNAVADESLHPVVGRIELEKSGSKEGLVLKGAGVFRKDKLVGWLDPLQTRGYLWIRDKVKSTIITVSYTEKDHTLVSLEVKKAGAKIKPYLENGDMKYRIEVSVESNVGEQALPVELEKPEIIAALEDKQREAVENEIRTVLDEAQKKYQIDILGIGAATAKKFPKEWKKMKDSWEDEFPNVEIGVTVKSKIKGTGLRTKANIKK